MSTLLLVSVTAAARPALVGLALAVVLVLVPRTRWPVMAIRPRIRRWIVAGAGLALLVTLAGASLPLLPLLGIDLPEPLGFSDAAAAQRVGILVPLVAGVLAVAVIALPAGGSGSTSGGSAALSRRTPTAFVAHPWPAVVLVLVAAAAGLAVAAGLASSQDEQGRWAMYVVDMGSAAIGTTIYGWYASVPALILIAVLIALAAAAIWRISRPPWGSDPVRDASARRQRSHTVLAVAAGALLLHLSKVLASLSGTAAIRGTAHSGDQFFRGGASFSAFEEPLGVLSTGAAVSGWALWGIVLLACLVSPRLEARGRATGAA
ncbi:hypothetical protein [Brachybacterium phenoliresistens]|uniref:hypothetical protein n=1 Tax=Brachybacterium phenoliresistens TaxID=396014 RepID=UPI0031D872DA